MTCYILLIIFSCAFSPLWLGGVGNFTAAPGGQQLRVSGHEPWDSRANPRNIKNKHGLGQGTLSEPISLPASSAHNAAHFKFIFPYTRSPASSLETVTCALSKQPRNITGGVCTAAPLHSLLVHSAAPRPHGNINGWVKNARARSWTIHYIKGGKGGLRRLNSACRFINSLKARCSTRAFRSPNRPCAAATTAP